MAYLILVRHGKSEWNALGLWTGWQDVELSDEGVKEAQKAANELHDITLHKAYAAKLKRVKQTVNEIKDALNLSHIPTVETQALNERNYGIYTGKNKWQVKEEVGEDEFQKIRRGWDHPIPNGETLEDVYNRLIPYFESEILKDLKEGKNVIVGGSGNSLRALVKYLEKISNEDISELEIGTGELYIYQVNEKGDILSKEIRAGNPNRGKI